VNFPPVLSAQIDWLMGTGAFSVVQSHDQISGSPPIVSLSAGLIALFFINLQLYRCYKIAIGFK
jgi:hypothetical protein